jgi:hypothetical protein
MFITNMNYYKVYHKTCVESLWQDGNSFFTYVYEYVVTKCKVASKVGNVLVRFLIFKDKWLKRFDAFGIPS